jgi:hypothetical protein
MTVHSERRGLRRSVLFTMAIGAVLLALPAAAHPPFCVESVNPHGQNTPPAGSTTLPGDNCHSGQNPDGFWLVGTLFPGTEICDASVSSCVDVCLFDTDGNSFGCFDSSTHIKYTEANGAEPSVKKIGSDNGQAGAVAWHIKGTGDLVVCSEEDPNFCTTCYVPPPPKDDPACTDGD